jgi:hypothetical protein
VSFKSWGIGFLIALVLAPFTLGASMYLFFIALTINFVLDIYISAMKFTVGAVIAIISGILKFVAKVFKTPYEIFEILMKQGSWNAKRRHGARKEEEDEDDDGNVVFSAFGSLFSAITTYKLRYVALLAFFIYFTNFPQMLMTVFVDPSQMDLSWLIDILPTIIFIIPIPFVATLVVSALSYEFLGPGMKFWKADALQSAKRLGAGGAAAAGAAVGAAGSAARNAGQAAAEAGRAGMEAKEMGETAVTTASHLDTAGGMMGEEAAGEAAAAEAGAAEGMLAESAVGGLVGGSAGAVLAAGLIALILYGIIVSIISLFLVAITWAYVVQLLPLVAGAVMPAIGLGNAYGQWIGQSTANIAGPQIGGMFQEEVRMVQHMGAKVGCALKGPQCLRQWRMNNTVRPGSDERGETYELRIDRFGLAQEKIDVAYKEKGYDLPINFLVYNTRHGLKGIRARDVSYRIMVEDASNQGQGSYCMTNPSNNGWVDIQTQESGNYILPGLGVTPDASLSEINLGDCGLLQPSMGVNRVLTMEMKYNYSSQATLYFDAMSRKYRRENQIMPGFEKSKTAKTPVQSYINIKAPVTYYTTEGGDRRPVPFPARFGFQTPGFSVDYHVVPETIDIDDSVYTQNTSNCNGLEKQSGNNYKISDRAKKRINDRQTSTRWFHRQLNPAPLRCTFELTEDAVETINPTGEQLIMRIDANYTIKREQEYSSFNVVNTRCTRVNCPMLVTDSYNDSHDPLLYDTCKLSTSVDSRGGCAVIKPTKDADFNDDGSVSDQSGDIDWTDPQVADGVTINQGETAYLWSELKDKIAEDYMMQEISSTYVGMEKNILSFMSEDNPKEGAVLYRNGNARKTDVRYRFCEENNNHGVDFKDYGRAFLSNRPADKLLYFRPPSDSSAGEAPTVDCDYSEGSSLWSAWVNFWDNEPSFQKMYTRCQDDAGSGQNAMVLSTGGNLRCYYGPTEASMSE